MDQFFPPSSGYRKLVVHFTINELRYAEDSVDLRMQKEMADGAAALLQPDATATIEANVRSAPRLLPAPLPPAVHSI